MTEEVSEKDIAPLRESLPGINDDCVDAFRRSGGSYLPNDVRECFPMSEPKRWSGLWLNQFEGSRFCEAPASECTYDTKGERIWLTFAPDLVSRRPQEEAADVLYEIEFVGRITETPGSFGHFGSSNKEIVVEKLLRLERIPNP